MNPVDAGPLGVAEGDLVTLTSDRGCVSAPARLTDIRAGTVLVPFHYGYWDTDPDRHDRAANVARGRASGNGTGSSTVLLPGVLGCS